MSEKSIVLKGISLYFPKQNNVFTMFSNALTKKVNHFVALKDINLEINQGEVVGIIGSNGSGKSTLLRVISGIYPADEGSVLIAGEISLLAGLGTGFSAHQTGRENAILYGSILGHGEKEMMSKLDEIISFSELGDFIDEPLRTYSAGMKARLGLAVASAINPNILLIDEVLGVGDPHFREKSKAKILEMVKGAGTVVIVSHSFGLMKEICDRVCVVDKGRLVFVGPPQDAVDKYYEITG